MDFRMCFVVGDEKSVVKAVGCCKRVDVTEQRMKCAQDAKILRYNHNFLLTFWTSESGGEAVITLENEKASCPWDNAGSRKIATATLSHWSLIVAVVFFRDKDWNMKNP